MPGLGSHAFGSFANKKDGHMWLIDALPNDLPTARVMIYGYESGLRGNDSFANLQDFAVGLRDAICNVLRSGGGKRLVLIGHSLGGLLVKEALLRMAASSSGSGLVSLVTACLFFGVPHDGMATESLIPMVRDGPNRFLVESLDQTNSPILARLSEEFSELQGKEKLEVFCFYETKISPTAAEVSTSQVPEK